MDNASALNQLRHNRTTAVLALAAIQLMNSSAVTSLRGNFIVIKEDEIIFNANDSDRRGKRFELDCNIVVNEYLHSNENYTESLKEFHKSTRRALIKESYEVVKAYTNDSADFKSQSWHRFARIIRNAISHDFFFHFDKHDKLALPLTWGHVTIDITMDGKEVTGDTLPHNIPFELFAEFENYVRNS